MLGQQRRAWTGLRRRTVRERSERATDDRVGAADRVPGRGARVRARGRGVYTRLLVDDADPQQHNFLMELVDNPAGLRAINRAE